MDRITRTAIIISVFLLALLVLSLTWSSFGWTPRIWQFNAQLQKDPVLASYPYEFRAVLFVTGIVTLTSPHADEVPLEPFLQTLDPNLHDKPATDPALAAARARFVEHEQRAIALLLAEPDVDSVIWSLDRAWYHQHKVPLAAPAQQPMAHLYFLLGLTALMLVVLALQIQRLLSRRIRFPYLAAETLLNPPQRALKNALEQTLGRDYRIYGRVRAAEVIRVQGHLTRLERQRAQARLDGLVFDCLICSLETTALAGAVNVMPAPGRWRERRANRRLQQKII